MAADRSSVGPFSGTRAPKPALAEVVGGAREPLGGPDHPYAEAVGHGDRAHDQRDTDAREDQPGGGDAAQHLVLGDEHLDDGDLPGGDRCRLEERGAAADLGDGRPAQPLGGQQVPLCGPAGADLHGDAARLAGGRYMDGQLSRVADGAGLDGPLQLFAALGDGEHGAEGRRLPFGVGERPVLGHLLDDEPERHGEGEHDHRGHRQRDPDERPSHDKGSWTPGPGAGVRGAGGSSFTPTPRRVCR